MKIKFRVLKKTIEDVMQFLLQSGREIPTSLHSFYCTIQLSKPEI